MFKRQNINQNGEAEMEMVDTMAMVSSRVEEEILLRNEYLAAENEILKSKISKPLRLNDGERVRFS